MLSVRLPILMRRRLRSRKEEDVRAVKEENAILDHGKAAQRKILTELQPPA